MTTKVLICDDSSFARKQMARSIPDGWDVDITFAENGKEGIERIREGLGDVLFLDLNMPIMDGYETIKVIHQEDLPCLVIVVSGDVQPQARERMMQMGALDFIRKPIDNEKLITLLHQYGLYAGEGSAQNRKTEIDGSKTNKEEDRLDAYRELVNVAIGRAGESLAKQLNEFINLPIPNVNVIETNELQMAIDEINAGERVSAVSKGFVSAGIRGEALVIFSDANADSMVELLNYKSANTQEKRIEALMDISNILIGACLNALSEQLSVTFCHTSPIILGRHCDLEVLLNDNISRGSKVMAIEIAYAIKDKDIRFDLLLLIPENAMGHIYSRLTQAMEKAK